MAETDDLAHVPRWRRPLARLLRWSPVAMWTFGIGLAVLFGIAGIFTMRVWGQTLAVVRDHFGRPGLLAIDAGILGLGIMLILRDYRRGVPNVLSKLVRLLRQ